jgi:hypothetical protein
MPSYKEVTRTKTTYANLPAYRVDFSGLWDETKPQSNLKGEMIILVHGGLGFIIMGETLVADLDKYGPVVEYAMTTFQPPSTQLAGYSDVTNGFSIVYPLTWISDSSTPGAVYIQAPSNTASVVVEIDHLTRTYSLDDYTAAINASYFNSSIHYSLAKSTKITIGDSTPAYLDEFTGTNSSGTKLVLKSLTVVNGLTGFTVAFVTTQGNAPLLSPIGDAILNSFQLAHP